MNPKDLESRLRFVERFVPDRLDGVDTGHIVRVLQYRDLIFQIDNYVYGPWQDVPLDKLDKSVDG